MVHSVPVEERAVIRPRLDALTEMYKPRKRTPASVDYVDVPGVAKGEGAALVDLPALRGVDALVHVVRAFESDSVPHPEGSVDPLRDARMLELELILADLGAVERRLERLEASIKKANKADDVAERAVFLKLKQALEQERPLRELELPEEDRRRLRSYSFLTEKPLLLAVNLGEGGLRDSAGFLESSGLAAFAASGGMRPPSIATPSVRKSAENTASSSARARAASTRSESSIESQTSTASRARTPRTRAGRRAFMEWMLVGRACARFRSRGADRRADIAVEDARGRAPRGPRGGTRRETPHTLSSLAARPRAAGREARGTATGTAEPTAGPDQGRR